jgi:hypothetical protein
MLIKRQNSNSILRVLGVTRTLMEFKLCWKGEIIVKMKEMGTSHVYLGFRRSY